MEKCKFCPFKLNGLQSSDYELGTEALLAHIKAEHPDKYEKVKRELEQIKLLSQEKEEELL